MPQLQDKVAIITGAASGIGEEIARHFAEEGAKVRTNALTGQSLIVSHGWLME